MKIYLDESGQTGCVIKKNDFLNFKDSPTFALAAVLVDEKKQETLKNKYLEFKKIFSIKGEIKGSDLLTKKNNNKLEYFMKNILDEVDVYINIYDKRFYLSTLILLSFCGSECIEIFKKDIYTQASILSKQDDEFFLEYLKFIENPTVESFHKYLIFLLEYDYKFFINQEDNDNILIVLSKKILEKEWESYFNEDFMTYGWYKDPNITNLINLNCLCELIYIIKKNTKKKTIFIHDKINEFEDIIINELLQYNCKLEFKDSKDEIMLQISDNIVSIFRHCYDKSIKSCVENKMWIESSFWNLNMFSKLQKQIGVDNIKYTIPISDWAASLSIKDMFSEKYSKQKRNNLFFNMFYSNYMLKISYDLYNNFETLNDVDKILNE